jgi:hypothetical protein
MTTGPPAKNAELMLQADKVDIVDVQEISSTAIRFKVPLRKFKSNAAWILITIIGVVDWQGNTGCPLIGSSDCFAQIGGECCDAAPAREIIADECNALQDRVG